MGTYSRHGEWIMARWPLGQITRARTIRLALIVSFAVVGIAKTGAQQRSPGPAPDEADQPIKTTAQNPDAVAVVIGIGQYQDHEIPPAGNAVNDADAVVRVLKETLGYAPKNIIDL